MATEHFTFERLHTQLAILSRGHTSITVDVGSKYSDKFLQLVAGY